MESSESRRQSDALPSINYLEFERAARDSVQFRQRHPSMARTSISAASPISPTTMLGPGPSGSHGTYQPPLPPNGIHTPPGSRRTSDDDDGRHESRSEARQSLPSLSEALSDKPVSFSAPSPIHTPPIGSGSFSAPSRTNSMPRSQPTEAGPSAQPPLAPTHPPAHTYPQPPAPSHDAPYGRHDSQSNGRTLPPNPYSQTHPPASIAPMHPPEPYSHPPPSSSTSTAPSQTNSPPFHHAPSYPPPPPGQASPHYQTSAPSFPASAPPQPSGSQYTYPPHTPAPTTQQPYHTPQSSVSYPYAPRDPSYPQPSPQHQATTPLPSAPKGVKRGSGYGSAIERALSVSAIRRDLEEIKTNASRIYHIVNQYQEMSSANGPQTHPGGLQRSLRDFSEALRVSQTNTEALENCRKVFNSLCDQEFEEQNAPKVNPVKHSDYGPEESSTYVDDGRSAGTQQPEQKKIRRGRAAPPGRCHSCHRAETPEWRRGPDGARTLCNACGLHYAKLTRKLSKNSLGSGPLVGRKQPPSPLP